MNSYEDFEDLLNEYNFVGSISGTTAIFGSSVSQTDNKYNITYTVFQTATDITNSGYYWQTVVDSFATTTYKQDVEDAFIDIMQGNFDKNSVLFQDVANISFLQSTTGTGYITLGQTTETLLTEQGIGLNKTAFVDIGSNANTYGDIWINTEHDSDPNPLAGENVWDETSASNQGSYSYKILLEEISHSLGIDIYRSENTVDQSQKYDPISNPLRAEFSSFDNQKYTVTSYNLISGMDAAGFSNDVSPKGLQLFDIAALQEIYGRNYDTRNELSDGDPNTTGTTYDKSGAFASSATNDAFIYTVWDGGGIDTISADGFYESGMGAGAAYGAVIDLRQGAFSTIGSSVTAARAVDNVAVAFHSVIENATGSVKADTIIGNAWDNVLIGGDGNDELYGDGVVYDSDAGFGTGAGEHDPNNPDGGPASNNSGDDSLHGGAGYDTLYGGAGNDTYVFELGDGDDQIIDSSGAEDTILLGNGIEVGDISFTVSGNDLVIDFDGSPDDSITIKNYYTTGYIENIQFQDEIDLNPGSEPYTAIYGTNGNERQSATIQGSNGRNLIYGLDGHDDIYGNGGDDVIYGGDGGDHIYGGDGNDILYSGTSYILPPQGVFYQGDFLSGGDGNDILDATEATEGVTTNGGEGDDIIITGYASISVFNSPGVDYIQGSQYSKIDYFIADNTNTSYLERGLIPVEHGINVDLSQGIILDNGFGDSGTILYIDHVDGSSYDDIIISGNFSGTSNNRLYGNGGNDSITGSNGQNTIRGGEGNDTINAGGGNDIISGEEGDDIIDGGSGNDSYRYARLDGSDTITDMYGTADEIRIYDSEGVSSNTQVILEYIGNDLHIDPVFGHANDKIVIMDQISSNSQSGIEFLKFSDGSQINLKSSNTFTGTSAAETITGAIGDDTIDSMDGDDTLIGGAGNDTLIGGAGNDTYIYTSGLDSIQDAGDSDILSLGSGINAGDIDFVSTGSDDVTLIINSGTDEIVVTDQRGTDSAKYIETLLFSNGANVSFSNYANWTMGSSGNDMTYAFSAGEVVVSGDGDDTVYAFSSSHTIFGGSGNDTIFVAGGVGGSHQLFGGDGNDQLAAESGDDWLEGGSGDDKLYGWEGNDTLIGGDGDDAYYYRAGQDGQELIIDDGGASDTLYLWDAAFEDIVFNETGGYDLTLTNAGYAQDSILLQNQRDESGSSQIETLVMGDSLDDFSVNIGDYNDWVVGATSADTLTGSAGQDDTIIGRAGDDTLSGLGGADTLSGDAGADNLYGGDGDDQLNGGSGDDILYGGDGFDVLIGGTGSDTFVFESSSSFNDVDLVKDFDSSEGDIIDISDLLDGYYTEGVDNLADFVSLTDDGTHTTIAVDQDGGGDSYSVIAVIESAIWASIATFQNDTLL